MELRRHPFKAMGSPCEIQLYGGPEVDAVARSFGARAGCTRAEGFDAPEGWIVTDPSGRD